MNTYCVITAEVNGSLKLGLVRKEEDDPDIDPEDFFPPSARNVESHGTVTIEGEAAHMIPDYIVEE